MKIKKYLYCAGLISTTTVTLLYSNRINYEKKVNNHLNHNSNHNANIIAHRGFSSLKLENSFNSVKLAFDTDCCDGVEIDVRLSKDEELVLAHDESPLGIGKIADKTLDELKENKCKNNCIKNIPKVKTMFSKDAKLVFDRNKKINNSMEHICTLNEIIDEINEKKILLVDLKFNDETDEIMYSKINDIFCDYDGNLEIIFQSDNVKQLDKMKELYPQYKYQVILKKKKDLKCLENDFDYYCIRKNLITKDMVDSLESENKKVSVWTINTYRDFKDLSNELGTSLEKVFIITDYPDEMCYLFNKEINSKSYILTLKR